VAFDKPAALLKNCLTMNSTGTFPRLFTVNEANALLPMLRPLMERILENVGRLRSKTEAVIRDQQLDPEAFDLMERLQENGEIARLVKEIKDWVEEIHRHGCLCKGVEQGLIDFPCMMGAEVVFLCWQLGEANVGHWHRIEDGFAGRRPLLEIEQTDPDGNTSYH
jgi:hypothetical protein